MVAFIFLIVLFIWVWLLRGDALNGYGSATIKLVITLALILTASISVQNLVENFIANMIKVGYIF